MAIIRAIFIMVLGLLPCLLACRSADKDQSAKPAPPELHPSHVRHDELSADQMERIRKLQQTFSEVDPTPIEKWVDDFKRDRDPDREIRIYEGMAEAYTAYCSGRHLTIDAKHDVYQVVLLRSGAPEAEVLQRLTLKALSVDDAKEILKLYKVPPAPITISTAPN